MTLTPEFWFCAFWFCAIVLAFFGTAFRIHVLCSNRRIVDLEERNKRLVAEVFSVHRQLLMEEAQPLSDPPRPKRKKKKLPAVAPEAKRKIRLESPQP